MPDRFRTSHAGSLPRPEDLVALNLRRAHGELDDEAGYQQQLAQAVVDVVARQREVGLDVVNDGEYGHSMGHRYDFGSWWTYVFQRLGGLELAEAGVLDIANLRTALDAAGTENGFLNAVAPGSCARFGNEYYDDDEETVRVEALNHAIRGLPPERIRFHLCWGSWHGPHVTDIPMADIVDVMITIDAGAYTFEAANVRHEHEWKVWQNVTLPEGKVILPGVVSHATNVVEHPEVVADRIVRFAQGVGPENVIASTDCGLGGRVHPQIAWAKLRSLAEGAALAGRQMG